MAALDSEHKRFIVIHLAKMHDVSEVKKKLSETYNIEVKTKQINNIILRKDGFI